MVLEDHADKNRRAWPSTALLLAETELGRRALFYALKDLKGQGLIREVGRHGRATIYEVLGASGAPSQAGAADGSVHQVHRRVHQVHSEGASGALGTYRKEGTREGTKEDPVQSAPRRPVSKPPAAVQPGILTFPTDGKPDSWSLTTDLLNEWNSDFPKLDVLAECRKARAWIKANPERRKTARGMSRFLVNWLSRATDRGGTSRAAPGPAGRADRNRESLDRFIRGDLNPFPSETAKRGDDS